MINNWLDKYKPLKTSDIIGHQDYIRLLTNYLNQYSSFDIDVKKIAYPCILINGKNGIGKTLMVDLLLKEKGFERAVISLDNVVINKTKKKIKILSAKLLEGTGRLMFCMHPLKVVKQSRLCRNLKNETIPDSIFLRRLMMKQ